jgi:hypothetical protein
VFEQTKFKLWTLPDTTKWIADLTEQNNRWEISTKFPWLTRAMVLDKQGRIEAALDTIYDQLDDLLIDEQFFRVDNFLSLFAPRKFSATLSLAVLSVTRPYRHMLSNRSTVCRLAREALLFQGKNPEKLLTRFDQ